jgi:hypothetical protein
VFFLQPFFTLLIAGLTLVGLARRQTGIERRDFGWFVIAALLASVSTSSYTFIVLLLPIALLLRDAGVRDRILLVSAFVALTFPLKLAWHLAFPRLWVLLALFLFVGREYWRALSPQTVATAVAIAALVASVSAWSHYRSYEREPGRRLEAVAYQPGAIFSASPAVSRAGLFYQSIAGGKYVLKWQTDRKIEELSFDGEAFQPFVLSPDGPVYFELVAHQQSTMMQFDPTTRITTQAPAVGLPSRPKPTTSPDGKWIIHESSDFGWKQLGLRNRETGAERVLAAGRCNNTSPVWELDSSAVIFSSDCDRSTGLPALYRARVSAP